MSSKIQNQIRLSNDRYLATIFFRTRTRFPVSVFRRSAPRAGSARNAITKGLERAVRDACCRRGRVMRRIFPAVIWRAFSASFGLTSKGRGDIEKKIIDCYLLFCVRRVVIMSQSAGIIWSEYGSGMKSVPVMHYTPYKGL